jgi:hypothetical protein
MEQLLAAWGRDWRWSPAPPEARQSVTLDVTRLSRLHRFTEADSDPATMAAEWQRYGQA